MDEETRTSLAFDLDGLDAGIEGNTIGLRDGFTEFQKGEAVVEIHLRKHFPIEETRTASRKEFMFAKGNFERVQCFYKRSPKSNNN